MAGGRAGPALPRERDASSQEGSTGGPAAAAEAVRIERDDFRDVDDLCEETDHEEITADPGPSSWRVWPS
ncbi:hypothetical protein PS467_31745 [Streptomyces luomodiensis]|uniref:Uncharacterized protein n=1 Tax=Streptomyces luomodiensis TaxID=3026192 RepID=A0ABY9V4N9_9ACTN|nr:hypothetical protein [Streptomyces sp. SCA4-21]WNE99581.1 hypothetical protein PS467_31745 [Streptomyces sp. SCA4-21]